MPRIGELPKLTDSISFCCWLYGPFPAQHHGLPTAPCMRPNYKIVLAYAVALCQIRNLQFLCFSSRHLFPSSPFYLSIFSLIIHYFPSLLLSALSLYFLALCCCLFLFNFRTMQRKSKKGSKGGILCTPTPFALPYFHRPTFPASPAFVLAAFCWTWSLVCTEQCITQGDSDFACGL